MVVSVTNDLKVVSAQPIVKGVTSLILCHFGVAVLLVGCRKGFLPAPPAKMKSGPYVHSSTHDQSEVCTMVIHDRSIDRCGRLAEGDVDGSAQIRIGILYAMQNICMECDLSESCAKIVIDGFIGNDDRSSLQLKTNNKRIENISIVYFSKITI